MHTVVERFKHTYGQLNAQPLGLLGELYSDDVEFKTAFIRSQDFLLSNNTSRTSMRRSGPVRSSSRRTSRKAMIRH